MICNNAKKRLPAVFPKSLSPNQPFEAGDNRANMVYTLAIGLASVATMFVLVTINTSNPAILLCKRQLLQRHTNSLTRICIKKALGYFFFRLHQGYAFIEVSYTQQVLSKTINIVNQRTQKGSQLKRGDKTGESGKILIFARGMHLQPFTRNRKQILKLKLS